MFHQYKATSTLMGSLVMLVAVGIAIAVSMTTIKGRRAWNFVKDARVEVRKVVWPSRPETIQTTFIVVVMVLIVAIIIWLMDYILRSGIYKFLYVWFK